MTRRQKLTEGEEFERSFVWFAQYLSDEADGAERYALACERVFGRWGTDLDDDLVIITSRHQVLNTHQLHRAPISVSLRRRLERQHRFACLYCGTRADILVLDHIVAYVRRGGHNEANLAPACQPCNSSKHDQPLARWLRRRPDLSEPDIRERWREARGDALLPGMDP